MFGTQTVLGTDRINNILSQNIEIKVFFDFIILVPEHSRIIFLFVCVV